MKEQFDPQVTVGKLVVALDEKARNVISARAGLNGDKKITLSQIGQQFKLSRERIRQIERDAMIKLSESLQAHEVAYMQFIVDCLEGQGGVVSEEQLVKLALPAARRLGAQINSLRLFLRLMPSIVEIKESKTMQAGWVLKTVKAQAVNKAIEHALSVIRESEEVVTFDMLAQSAELVGTGEHFLKNALSLSKEIITTTDGQYGLASWSTINPKNVRDKIYYVLYEHGKPLHFTEITRRIREKSFDGKKVVQPTVHNELIADERFVLVGRGIYALSQWGYEPGTVEDIIEEILRKAKNPLTTDEIVAEVLKSRHVKKNTIVINLQIKPQFVKVGKKLYSLSETTTTVPKELTKTIRMAESKAQ